MKFTYIIGNPPYQEDTEGTSDKPLYHTYMDATYELADKVMLITPGRFLFNAGKTPKEWNKKMLSDPHLKVESYEQDSTRVFPNASIMGGVAVTYHDKMQDFGAIGTFTPYEELNSILSKVKGNTHKSLADSIYAPESYRFSKIIHDDHPELINILSNGHPYDLTSNIFDKLSDTIFFDEEPDDTYTYVRIYGRKNNNRTIMYIRKDYILPHKNLEYWKVFVPKSNGSGAIGQVPQTVMIGEPVVGEPNVGHTQSFISIGAYDTEFEANACYKYVKTKFTRTLVGILKVTQDNKKSVWKYVPLQDFTPSSDIDWTASIPEIDQQLYRKYNLDQSEIDFIESHVKPME